MPPSHALDEEDDEQEAVLPADMDARVKELCAALAEAERGGHAFIALKWFRDSFLPRKAFRWNQHPETRQAVLAEAIQRGVVLTSKIANPKTPAYPTTTIRLNRAEAGIPEEAQRFHPVAVHGELHRRGHRRGTGGRVSFYFLEATAFVKLFVRGPGTEALIRLMEAVEDNRKLISAATPLEVYAAIRRRERAGDIAPADAAAALEILRLEAARMVQQPLNPAVLEMARQLLDRTTLRWPSAFQLAAALTARDMFRNRHHLCLLLADSSMPPAAKDLKPWIRQESHQRLVSSASSRFDSKQLRMPHPCCRPERTKALWLFFVCAPPEPL